MTTRDCDCCAGVEALTPLPTANRPGLDALALRVGSHATFLETMVARLTSHELDDGSRPLQRLRTREPDDPAIAMLDAWATVADVLTFYQERIGNEGYLRTATERRSVVELARLVGYTPRPGVAASAYLAFTLDDRAEVEIPAGTRAASVPGPGEQPQAFETDEALPARAAWNALAARQTRPSVLEPVTFEGTRTLYLQGTATNLRTNDVILIACDTDVRSYQIRTVEPDTGEDRTVVAYAPYGARFSPADSADDSGNDGDDRTASTPLTRLADVVAALRKDLSRQPFSRYELERPPDRIYDAAADLGPQLLTRLDPQLRDTLYAAYANASVTGVGTADLCQVVALRVAAAPFGHNAPKPRPPGNGNGNGIEGAPAADAVEDWPLAEDGSKTLALDAVYDIITPGDHVVIDRGHSDEIVARVQEVRTVSRADYDITGRVTELLLDVDWLTDDDTLLDHIRRTTVYTADDRLPLADEPIPEDVGGDSIELDGLYDGLSAGRWLLIRGERSDVVGPDDAAIDGVEASELVMLAGVTQDVHSMEDAQGNTVELASDSLHTRLLLADSLAYTYRRETVTINANVVGASHGETRRETLGSGDTTTPFQRFILAHSPLTYVAAETADGIESTLDVRVDDVRWPPTEALFVLAGDERGYETHTDDDGTTTVVFGDGAHGARVPTGVENVTAVYRSGIGSVGNVEAGQITNLVTRPLGVREVVNPQRASGGADPETRDQARRNVPLATSALDRLVSVDDHTGFARTFAGIGKAHAARLSDGRRELVHLTIAGAADAPIDPGSALDRNLRLSLRRYGDPSVPVLVVPRERIVLLISARVATHPDHLWEVVEPRVRSALLDAFGFDRRELGQDVLLSEVASVFHAVQGVDHVDIDLLTGLDESEALDPAALGAALDALAAADSASTAGGACPGDVQPAQRVPVALARIDTTVTDPSRRIRPAQLCYVDPAVPDTLILTEVTS